MKWTKSALIIDEHDLRSLKVDNHVGLMITIDINEVEGDWYKVGIGAIELGANVDTSVACVTTWQFDDFNPPVKVDGEKMTGHSL